MGNCIIYFDIILFGLNKTFYIVVDSKRKRFIKLYGVDLIVWVSSKLDYLLIVYIVAIEQITLCFINVMNIRYCTWG